MEKTKEYELYGPEWVKELMKHSKASLIDLYKRQILFSNNLTQQTAALQQRVKELEGEWVSVEEMLPDHNCDVLCWDGRNISTANRYRDKLFFVKTTNDHDGEGDYEVTVSVTHWRPLPPPPGN